MYIMHITAGVLLIISIFCIARIIYDLERYPKESLLFSSTKNNKINRWVYNVNWDYAYLFSVKKISKVIYAIVKKYSACHFKIGEGEIGELYTVSKIEIIKMVENYRNSCIREYDNLDERCIYEIANDIEKKEQVNLEEAISKAIWIVYGTKPQYRKCFRSTIFNLYYGGQITKKILDNCIEKYKK